MNNSEKDNSVKSRIITFAKLRTAEKVVYRKMLVNRRGESGTLLIKDEKLANHNVKIFSTPKNVRFEQNKNQAHH